MLVILTTHPIQYQVPLWQKMAEAGIDLEVWYFTKFGIQNSYDTQFNKSFSWDLPLLEGYKYRFLKVNEGANPNGGFKDIIIKESLSTLFKINKVTHVYINGWQVFAYWQALYIAKSLKLVTILKAESNDLKPEKLFIWPIKRILLSYFFNKVDHYLYIGKANKRLYEKYGVKEDRLLPGLYSVDNKRFNVANLITQKRKDELKSRWGLEKDAFVILFSGKFIEKKRPLDLISAVKLIKKKVHILFVGDGELYSEIKDSTNVIYDKNSGLINVYDPNKVNVSIIGFLNQTEIPQAYAVADCLVLPSNFGETWGLVVNEALASGIPAIVSNECGSAEDLISPIDEKLIFESGNVDNLKASICYLMENLPPAEKIISVINKYTFQPTVNSIKKIISSNL